MTNLRVLVTFSSLEEAGVQGQSPCKNLPLAKCEWSAPPAYNKTPITEEPKFFQFPVIGTMLPRRWARMSRGPWNKPQRQLEVCPH